MDREYNGSRYTILGVNAEKEGYAGLELFQDVNGEKKRAARVIFRDPLGRYFLQTLATELPLEIVEAFVAEAKAAIKAEPAASQPERADAGGAGKRPLPWPWFAALVLGATAVIGWLIWPSMADWGIDAHQLSREDRRPRFIATHYLKPAVPPMLTLPQRVAWEWEQFKLRHSRRNPAAVAVRPSPVRPCSIDGTLRRCMELTGTQYLIAVEVGGPVQFGNAKPLNGAQWVAAFEHAIETNGPVWCYDFADKGSFRDTLVVIRERPGLIKVVPKSKVAEYQAAGLLKTGVP